MFSPDGKVVLTASADGTARLSDALSGVTLAVLHGHTGIVNDAAFSPDGKLLVTASGDKTARVYDCEPCGTWDELLTRARERLVPG